MTLIMAPCARQSRYQAVLTSLGVYIQRYILLPEPTNLLLLRFQYVID